MTQQRDVAPDGMHVVTLEPGDTVELPDDLAASFISRGLAAAAPDSTERKARPAAPENKAQPAPAKTQRAPRNKARGSAPETKAADGAASA